SCACSTRRDCGWRICACTPPLSMTSSSLRLGARWRARRIMGAARVPARPQPSPSRRELGARHTGWGAGSALDAEDPAPTLPDVPGGVLPSDAARGERIRAARGYALAGLSHELLHLLRD